jgi:hypothetical protein
VLRGGSGSGGERSRDPTAANDTDKVCPEEVFTLRDPDHNTLVLTDR